MTLFGDPEPVKTPRPIKGVQWTRAATRSACDVCQLAQHGGARVLARKAELRRRTTGSDQRLCYVHAHPIREADYRAKEQAKTK